MLKINIKILSTLIGGLTITSKKFEKFHKEISVKIIDLENLCLALLGR